MRIAVSGLGRIGRSLVRALVTRGGLGLELSALHDIADQRSIAYLMQYDSVRGVFPKPVVTLDDVLMIGTQRIDFVQSAKVPNWESMEIDVVIDCTGSRTSRVGASKHIEHGARMVIVSAPVNDADNTVVYGYNHRSLTYDNKIISAASCTTNCLVQMLLAVKRSAKIEFGLMSTVHAYTADQRLVDSPHKDRRRGRAAALNIVPTTTGAARAVGVVIPDLLGLIDGCSFRVPTPNVSLIDLTLQLKEPIDVRDMNQSLSQSASNSLVLDARSGPIVSSDILGSPASCTIDLDMTMAVGTLLKIVGWYDNEWGYANRLVDILSYIADEDQFN
jgi:glyceraldehyde 3-phosphate dehydrogenase